MIARFCLAVIREITVPGIYSSPGAVVCMIFIERQYQYITLILFVHHLP